MHLHMGPDGQFNQPTNTTHNANKNGCTHVPVVYSPRRVPGELRPPAQAESQVGSSSNYGHAQVVSGAAVDPPALLDLVHPEKEQPDQYGEHAHADDKLHKEEGYVDPNLHHRSAIIDDDRTYMVCIPYNNNNESLSQKRARYIEDTELVLTFVYFRAGKDTEEQ